MSDQPTTDGVRERFAVRGEEALGKLAQDLLDNPLVNGALNRVLGVREKAAQAQEVAMGAMNIPSASDIERLTRRLRSVSQRLEGIEDGLDRIEQSAKRKTDETDIGSRLAAIEARLAGLSRQVEELGDAPDPVSHAQERLRVEDHVRPLPRPRSPSGEASPGRPPAQPGSRKPSKVRTKT